MSDFYTKMLDIEKRLLLNVGYLNVMASSADILGIPILSEKISKISKNLVAIQQSVENIAETERPIAEYDYSKNERERAMHDDDVEEILIPPATLNKPYTHHVLKHGDLFRAFSWDGHNWFWGSQKMTPQKAAADGWVYQIPGAP